MSKCNIIGCISKTIKNKRNISFHRLPTNETKRNKWLDLIGRENININTKFIYLCSLHFHENDFNTTLNLKRLRDDSLPSRFLKAHAKPKNVKIKNNMNKQDPTPSRSLLKPKKCGASSLTFTETVQQKHKVDKGQKGHDIHKLQQSISSTSEVIIAQAHAKLENVDIKNNMNKQDPTPSRSLLLPKKCGAPSLSFTETETVQQKHKVDNKEQKGHEIHKLQQSICSTSEVVIAQAQYAKPENVDIKNNMNKQDPTPSRSLLLQKKSSAHSLLQAFVEAVQQKYKVDNKEQKEYEIHKVQQCICSTSGVIAAQDRAIVKLKKKCEEQKKTIKNLIQKVHRERTKIESFSSIITDLRKQNLKQNV